MLVKQSIVEKWYQRDSRVYKNFSYLFVNPLWEKRIPSGFSVCPYFWLSMISLFLFRPLIVAPIQYVFKPMIHLGGKPVAWLDRIIYDFINWCGLNDDIGGYKSGYGFLMTLVLTILGTGFLAILGFAGQLIHKAYLALSTTNQGVFEFWSIASFAALFGIIKLHQKFTKTECKTMYYLLVWLVLFIPSIFVFIPNDSAEIFGGIVTVIGHGMVNFIAALWYVLTLVGSFVWSWTKVIAVWKPIATIMLPWWGLLILLTIGGWIVDKVCVFYENKHKTYLFQTNPTEVYNVYRAEWVETLVQILLIDPTWGGTNRQLKRLVENEYVCRAAASFRYILYRQTIHLMWKDVLDKLQTKTPHIPKSAWSMLKKSNASAEAAFRFVLEKVSTDFPDFPVFYEDTFSEILKDVIAKDPAVAILANTYRLEEETLNAKAEAEKTSWSHKMCLAVTGKLASGFGAVGNGCKWLVVSIATFAVYMWMLIKAKKQGACPYFRFTDVNQPTPKTENNQPK